MRLFKLVGLTCLVAVLAGCASSEPKREKDFFERISEQQEKRESARRDSVLARAKARRGEKVPELEEGDGTLEYFRRGKEAKGPKAAISVTWEGLAREREVAANSKYKRPQGAASPPMKITLVTESHPSARGIRSSRTKEERSQGAHSAVLRDADLVAFVKGLKKRGFFELAQSTGAQEGSFGHPRARGRVTIEQNGQSVTLLSMRGQGLSPRTKKIPAMYSESKQAIMTLRNRTPGLALSSVETDSILPGFGR